MWPDASSEGVAAAAITPAGVIPELEMTADWEPRTDWFMRDVPISMETVVENVSIHVEGLSASCTTLTSTTLLAPCQLSTVQFELRN